MFWSRKTLPAIALLGLGVLLTAPGNAPAPAATGAVLVAAGKGLLLMFCGKFG